MKSWASPKFLQRAAEAGLMDLLMEIGGGQLLERRTLLLEWLRGQASKLTSWRTWVIFPSWHGNHASIFLVDFIMFFSGATAGRMFF